MNMKTDITDKRELQIRDAMEIFWNSYRCPADAFSKDLLLLMLNNMVCFDSFQFACKNFKECVGQTDIAKQ